MCACMPPYIDGLSRVALRKPWWCQVAYGGGLLKGTAHGTACPASSICDRSCMRDRHSVTESGVKASDPKEV